MLIYGAIAVFGVIVLLSLLFVGELFGGDHELSHEMVAGHDADHGVGPSIFSTRIIASFLTAFGVGGVIGRYYNLSHPMASGLGVIVGVVMSSVVFQFARILYSQQASSELHMTSLVGTTAEVSVAISSGGLGQIVVRGRGDRSEHLARSADGAPIARGITVVITAISGDSLTVAPAGTTSVGAAQ